MFGDFIEAIQKLLFLVRDTQENTSDIEKLKKEVQILTIRLEALAFGIERTKQNEQHEREKFALQVENALLRAGRQLPPSS